MLSLRSLQLLNHPQEVVWCDQTSPCVCVSAHSCTAVYVFSLSLCMCSLITVHTNQFLICVSLTCSMCNSDNPCHLHVCAYIVSMCFCLQLVYVPWCDFLMQTALNRGLLQPSVVKLLSKQGWGIQTNPEHTANGSCQDCIAELTSPGSGEWIGRGGLCTRL